MDKISEIRGETFMKKVLLYSGGMDSWLISKLWKPDIKLYVDMKSSYSSEEVSKLPDDVKVVSFPLGEWEKKDKIIPLRNLYLCMVACNITGDEDVDICIGATAGDRVLDKSKEFVNKATELLSYLYSPQWWLPNGKSVKISIYYKDYTKEMLLKEFKESGGNLDEAFQKSFSCYNPTQGKECWHCKPCFRKFVAFSASGYKFDNSILNTVIPYIKNEILPQIESGTYGRGKEEEEAILRCVQEYDNCGRF